LIVHGTDGVDELSLSAPTRVCEVRGDRSDLVEYTITPEELGLPQRSREEVLGGDAQQNAAQMRRLLAGEERGGLADIVALNAGAALHVSGQAASMADGVKLAADTLRTGRAAPTLDALAVTSRAFATVGA
jgi:anthranilate phosphoribosyltransferase